MNVNLTINFCCRVFGRGGLVMLALLFSLVGAKAVAFQDYFTNRETLFTTNGTLLGTNTTATIEVGEPRTGGRRGVHSLWISWLAPTNGIATFDTHGSSFDTLMSAYTLSPTNGTTVSDLHEEARNDDDPTAPPTSLIQFGAIAGRTYQIAVDGYQNETGLVVMSWSFVPADEPPPIIVNTPNDQAAKQGDTVTLNVNLIASPTTRYDWYFNDNAILNDVDITNQSSTNLIITSLQPTNVGRYKLRVTVGSGNNRVRFFTTPVEIQINSDGATNSLGQDKLLDSLLFPLVGSDGTTNTPSAIIKPKIAIAPINTTPVKSLAAGVVRGYNGSQVFNTTYATTDPAEPPHCGVTGGSSYWLLYQPPTNGTITLDTIGSSYDTVMEVYTYNGTLTGYGDLISVACDNDSVASNGPSRVVFQAVKARQYVVVVDGVNGSRGTAWLNYVLNTNLPAQPPTLQSLVATQTVVVGANVSLTPSFTGAPPLKYSWKKNGVTITNATLPFLQLTNVTTAATANYTLTISNDLGTLTVTNPLHVLVPPTAVVSRSAQNLNYTFPTVASFRYTIQSATNILGPWTEWSAPFFGTGENFTTNIAGSGTKFFRLRVE